MNVLNSFILSRQQWKKHCPHIELNPIGDGAKKTASNVLSYSNITLNDVIKTINTVESEPSPERVSESPVSILEYNKPFEVSSMIYDTVDANCKYYLYLNRQEYEIKQFKSEGGVLIPKDIEYSLKTLPTLSGEEVEKLNKFRPETLHHASQIEGMTPAGMVYLHQYVKRENLKRIGNNINK
jgi:tRNA U34 5-carboxymethylaminomethyl modifying enzyme MnmG/GidA